MDEKERHIITFDINPDEGEDLSVSQKVVIPSMTPSVKPEADKAPTPEFDMTPSTKPEASKSLANDFWSINKSSKIESASKEFDNAQDAAAGINSPAAGAAPKPPAAPATSETLTVPKEPAAPAVPKEPTTPTVPKTPTAPKEPVAPAAPKGPVSPAVPKTTTAPAVSANGGGAGSGTGGGNAGGAHFASKPAKPPKPKKEKKYVTRGGLVACMIITMLLSTLFGTFLGTGFSKLDNVISNPDNNRAERDDDKLSQLNLSDATGSELTVAEIVDMNEDAVVEIVVSGTSQGMWGQMQLTEGAGSGVIIRKDGYIVTNYHVIQGANKVEVTLHNGNVYPASIVGSDPANDVAVVKIDDTGLKSAVIGDSSKVDVGDLAVAIGNPLGQLGGSVTTGIISALDRTLSVEGTTLTLLQTDAAINGGNSGGGLFNSRGELIGIVESKASAVGVEGLAFALPINTVAEIINDIIENGGNVSGQTAGTPAVGIVISDVSEEQSQYYGLEEPGVYIAQVTGHNAIQAGFKEQDRIVSFNGSKVENSSEFIALVRKCKVGDTVSVIVSRSGQEIEIKTELEELQTNQ